jgi:glyoxylase-like metal-dependent hydrolase (beta-lactamase superfamily II)/rhodanese-related sulfurtransferase
MKLCKTILLVLALLLSGQIMAAQIQDSESASHDVYAAKYQVEAVYEGNGFKIVQYNLAVLSHFSYLLISDGKVLVIDPGRDIETYLEYARKENLEWVGTFLTHSHADFVAGHREMAHATGAPIYAGHKSGDLFPHIAVKENDSIAVGKATLKVLETPGHTPDGLCGLVAGEESGQKGQFLLSGDTLFVGSVGRPDLMGANYSAAQLAGMMFDSWNNKLSKLADSVVVLPAHGAGSLCGANLSAEPSSTIGQEKRNNPYVKFADNRSAFIANVLQGLKDAPAYFKENARINKEGPELVDWKNPLGNKVESLNGIMNRPDIYIVDVRNAAEYAKGHVWRAVNIALRGRIETWTGIIVPFNARLILHGSEEEVLEAAHRLKRVGYNADYLDFGKQFANTTAPMIEPSELRQRMKQGKAPVIVDVRLPDEWMGMRIGEVINIPLNKLEELAGKKLDQREEIVTVCNSAFRSSLAIGLLERNGFKNGRSMKGGAEAWVAAGYPVIKISTAEKQADEAVEYRNLGLPERISANELMSRLKDLPGSLEIVDIRPKNQVLGYNPLNAQHADIGELIESQRWLVGDVPLLIVDRDGTLAMMAAGILSRKTKREIKVLRGGIEAFWQQQEMGFIKDRMIPVGPAKVVPDAKTEPAAPKTAPESRPRKRKSAGC